MQESFLPEDEQSKAPLSAAPKAVMSVLVRYPVDKAYDYIVPDGMNVRAGDYVVVPLGNREIPAVVWGEAANEVPAKKL